LEQYCEFVGDGKNRVAHSKDTSIEEGDDGVSRGRYCRRNGNVTIERTAIVIIIVSTINGSIAILPSNTARRRSEHGRRGTQIALAKGGRGAIDGRFPSRGAIGISTRRRRPRRSKSNRNDRTEGTHFRDRQDCGDHGCQENIRSNPTLPSPPPRSREHHHPPRKQHRRNRMRMHRDSQNGRGDGSAHGGVDRGVDDLRHGQGGESRGGDRQDGFGGEERGEERLR